MLLDTWCMAEATGDGRNEWSSELKDFMGKALVKDPVKRSDSGELVKHACIAEDVLVLQRFGYVPVLQDLMRREERGFKSWRGSRQREFLEDDSFFITGEHTLEKSVVDSEKGTLSDRVASQMSTAFPSSPNEQRPSDWKALQDEIFTQRSSTCSEGEPSKQSTGQNVDRHRSASLHDIRNLEPIGMITASWQDDYRILRVPVKDMGASSSTDAGLPGCNRTTILLSRNIGNINTNEQASRSMTQNEIDEEDMSVEDEYDDSERARIQRELNQDEVSDMRESVLASLDRGTAESTLYSDLFDVENLVVTEDGQAARSTATVARTSTLRAFKGAQAESASDNGNIKALLAGDRGKNEERVEKEIHVGTNDGETRCRSSSVLEMALPVGTCVTMRGPMLQLRVQRGSMGMMKIWKTVWLSLTTSNLVIRKGELDESKFLIVIPLTNIQAVQPSGSVDHGLVIRYAQPKPNGLSPVFIVRRLTPTPSVIELGTENSAEQEVWLKSIRHNQGVVFGTA